jgi:MFS family permease
MITALVAILCFAVSAHPYILNAVFFLLGSVSLPLYGLSMAHINDHLTPRQYVGGSASAILVNGAGAATGPLVISVLMSIFGVQLYFPLIALVFVGLVVYGVHRTRKRDAVPLEDQGDHQTMPLRPTPISMTITEEGHSILKEMEKSEDKN